MNDCCCKSKFLIGLGLGAVLGAVCYHLSQTQQAKELKHKMNEAIHHAGDRAYEAWQSTKSKMNPSESSTCPDCSNEA